MLALSDVATVLSLLYSSRLLVIGVTGTVRLRVSDDPAMLENELATEAAAPVRPVLLSTGMPAPSVARLIAAAMMAPAAHSRPPSTIWAAFWVAGFGVLSGRSCTCFVCPLKIVLAIVTETLDSPPMPLMTPCTQSFRPGLPFRTSKNVCRRRLALYRNR